MIAGLLICPTAAADSVYRMYAGMFFNAIGFSVATVGIQLWAVELGGDDVAAAIKNVQLFYQGGGLITTYLTGVLAERCGSYRPAFFIFAVLLFLSFTLIQILYIKKARR